MYRCEILFNYDTCREIVYKIERSKIEKTVIVTTTMMYTKSCFFFACALAFALARAESQSMIQKAVDSCAVKHGFPDTAYDNFVLYDLNMKLDDCVAACAMKKLGTMSRDGVFTGDKVKELMDKAPLSEAEHKKTDEVIDECATKYGKGGKDSCETVKNLRTCYEVVLRGIMDDDRTISGSVNQVLLFSVDDYADAYPNGKSIERM